MLTTTTATSTPPHATLADAIRQLRAATATLARTAARHESGYPQQSANALTPLENLRLLTKNDGSPK